MVCLQTELAAIRYGDVNNNFFSGFENYLEDLAKKNRTFIEDIFKRGAANVVKCQENFVDYGVVDDTLNYRPSGRYVKNNDEVQFVMEHLKILNTAGIRIVFIDIPRPLQVEKIIYNDSFVQQLTVCLDK